MTIDRTRYRNPKEHCCVNEWAETRIHRRRAAPRKIEIAVERHEANPAKPELVRCARTSDTGAMAGKPLNVAGTSLDDEPRYSKVDLAIAIGIAVLIAVWILMYAAVVIQTLFT